MKKALIIGAGGFVGGYLARCLQDEFDMEVYATKLPGTEAMEDLSFLAVDRIRELDILNKHDIVELLYDIRPDYIFHLAAQSSVSAAWKNPALTIDVNIKGSVNVMDAIRELYYKPRIVLVGSGEEYGHVREEDTPINEETKLRPGNIYAATKACQNMIGSIYSSAYDMELMLVRAFNHVGPGQTPVFVVSDFCKQVVEIEAGIREPVMYVGNLAAKRDFTDVRDVVRAYGLLALKGRAGETYNVGSGRAVSIQWVLDEIIRLSGVRIEVRVDANKIRPVDVPIIEADIGKICKETGWKPQIPFERTICEILDYWRQRTGGGHE